MLCLCFFQDVMGDVKGPPENQGMMLRVENKIIRRQARAEEKMLEKLESDERGKKRVEHGALSPLPGPGALQSRHPGWSWSWSWGKAGAHSVLCRLSCWSL